MNRVVITGTGIYSCIGLNTAEVSESLQAGRSGIQFVQERKDIGYASALAGIVPRPELKGLLDRRARIMMPEEAEFAYMAALQAFDSAQITPEIIAQRHCGIIFGNDSTVKPVYEGIDLLLQKKRYSNVGFRIHFPIDELNSDYEPLYHLRTYRRKLHS